MRADDERADREELSSLAQLFHTLQPLAHASWHMLDGRAGDANWPHEPAWSDYLLALPAAEVDAAERLGLQNVQLETRPPPSLESLCRAIASASTALGRGGAATCESCAPPERPRHGHGGKSGQSAAKRAQVHALLAGLSERLDLGSVRRVVDTGCGRGHLISALQAELHVPALGLERDPQLVETARAQYPHVAFESRDLLAQGLECEEGDLVVGLHPCGALGEAVVDAVRRRRGASLLMVPCCWHKQGCISAREPLSSAGKSAALRLPLAALKKASMALDSSGSLPSRRARHGLRELLRARGVDAASLDARREMDGLHPRAARRGLEALAAEALQARGLEPPAAGEVDAAAARAEAGFERERRLSLLEPLLGELVELLALLDRALALEEAPGREARVFRAFDASASDRNLAILSVPTSVPTSAPACAPASSAPPPAAAASASGAGG